MPANAGGCRWAVGKFDPTRFIAAERELSQLSQPHQETVAAVDTFAGMDKDYDFRRFRAATTQFAHRRLPAAAKRRRAFTPRCIHSSASN